MSANSGNPNILYHTRLGTLLREVNAPRLLVPLLLLLAVSICTLYDSPAAAQTQQNQAGLVIQGPDNAIQTFCIPFDGDTISGLDLLTRSGLPLKVEAYGGLGAEICQIGPTGCDYPNQICACQSYGTNGVYWNYHHLQDNKWKTSIAGAGTYRVHPGDVDGWAWSAGTPPEVRTFSEICPAPSAPPPPPPSPSPTARPTSPPPTPSAPRPTPTHALPLSPTISAPIQNTPQPPLTSTVPPTITPTNTPTLTTTPTATSTLPPTSAPTAIATSSHTPSPTPPLAPVRPEDTARTIGLVIAAGVVAALALWGGVTLIRRAGTNTKP